MEREIGRRLWCLDSHTAPISLYPEESFLPEAPSRILFDSQLDESYVNKTKHNTGQLCVTGVVFNFTVALHFDQCECLPTTLTEQLASNWLLLEDTHRP